MTPTVEPIYWIAFLAFIAFLLVLDLFVFHRKAHVVQLREAAIFSAFWISLGVASASLVFFWRGSTKGVEFFTGYLIEKSLSVDNVFVFALIFAYFAVPPRATSTGSCSGASSARSVMRARVHPRRRRRSSSTFHWILYVFGAFLVFTGRPDGPSHGEHGAVDPEQQRRRPVRARRFVPCPTLPRPAVLHRASDGGRAGDPAAARRSSSSRPPT